jgi:hypothetical protein
MIEMSPDLRRYLKRREVALSRRAYGARKGLAKALEHGYTVGKGRIQKWGIAIAKDEAFRAVNNRLGGGGDEQ